MDRAYTREEITHIINSHPSRKVKIAITDIDGVLRGKVIDEEKFLSILDGGFGFCDVVFGWDAGDVAYDNTTLTGWHTGYPDATAYVDINTFRKIPWDNELPFFLADFRGDDRGLPSCPRSLLRFITARIIEAGFYPMVSLEYEWFTFEETPASFAERGYINPRPMTPGMFGYSILRSSLKADYFNSLFDWLKQFDVPLEGLHTETGPGVYEAAIRYAHALEAGDRAVLFKTGVKEIAYRHGLMASFMAKWTANLPGCSGHIHQSLWDIDKSRNLFSGTVKRKMSRLMEHFIAGQLYCLPYILPMYAPTVNSYKRLVEGAWAPTTLTWGYDNRTVAIRALVASPTSTRVEMRVPGADANPYLAIAASLASGFYGIQQRMKLKQPETIGNGYKDLKFGTLPRNLAEAVEVMKKSDIAETLFGKPFTEHFIQTREWEWRQFNQAVTDWELKRYFEII